MQMVTRTFRFSASASAAATIVLIADRFKYFFEGSSAALIRIPHDSNSAQARIMRIIVSQKLVTRQEAQSLVQMEYFEQRLHLLIGMTPGLTIEEIGHP